VLFPHKLAMTPYQAAKMHRQAVLQIMLAHNTTNARCFDSLSQGLGVESSD
jgi:hypothetical protein